MRFPIFVAGISLLVSASFPAGASAQEKPILGILVPMSGPAAPIGMQIKEGVETAVEAINEKGGIKGQRIILAPGDDQSKPDVASAIAERLIMVDKATALIGVPLASAALAVRERAQRQKVLMISLSSFPGLTGPDFKLVLRPIGRQDALATMVADYVKSKYRGRKIGAWLSERNQQFATSFTAAASSRGLSFFRLDERASDNAIPNWSQEVDVIVASPGLAANASRLVEQNSIATVLALNVAEPSDLELARKYENVRIISNPGPQFFPESGDMLAQAKSKNRQPTGYFMYGYVAAQIFAALAGSAKDFSGEALSAAAREKAIPTAAGNLRFDGSGDLIGWRFAVWSKSGNDIAAVDVCKQQDCKDYSQCPPDCPK